MATKISNPINTVTNTIGNIFAKIHRLTMNPAITFNNTCPAIIFAVRRNDRLNGLAKKLNISIIIINGTNHQGVPLGRNNEKNLNPCKINPVKIITVKIIIAKTKFIIIWLVVVKA